MRFDNSYAKLPEQFYARLTPSPVKAPNLIKLNVPLANDLGLNEAFLSSEEGIQVLAGNQVLTGSDPIAMAYGGHQFGGWVPQLGDGRAMLLGEVLDRNGKRFDIQLKGSGRTPFSRNGDGRAWFGPVLREYVVSEAMAALNIPTTRALAVVSSGEAVVREDYFPGAILTRVAQAHIRVGTFEFFAARSDVTSLNILADYTIERFYPEARDTADPYLSLFENVLAGQAALIAKWLGVGFIHGVMNTDNMSIAGETLDYGPCAFMDGYHPDTVFSSIDYRGRYAYANQPKMAKWNLASFASTLLPLIDSDKEKAAKKMTLALDIFDEIFATERQSIFCTKLGLVPREEGDTALINDFLNLMADENTDFTQTFRGLCDLPGTEEPSPAASVRVDFNNTQAFKNWESAWQARLRREPRSLKEIQTNMRAVNPAFIPRNHLIEQMIAAALNEDFAPFERLNEVLSRPYDDQPEFADLQAPPKRDEIVHRTFCGT